MTEIGLYYTHNIFVVLLSQRALFLDSNFAAYLHACRNYSIYSQMKILKKIENNTISNTPDFASNDL